MAPPFISSSESFIKTQTFSAEIFDLLSKLNSSVAILGERSSIFTKSIIISKSENSFLLKISRTNTPSISFDLPSTLEKYLCLCFP